MSFVFKVKESYKKILQPVIHIDGTCRVQTISNNIFFEKLFNALKNNNFPEMIINTSLNVRGMPICRNPDDALSTFYTTAIDVMIFNNTLVMEK